MRTVPSLGRRHVDEVAARRELRIARAHVARRRRRGRRHAVRLQARHRDVGGPSCASRPPRDGRARPRARRAPPTVAKRASGAHAGRPIADEARHRRPSSTVIGDPAVVARARIDPVRRRRRLPATRCRTRRGAAVGRTLEQDRAEQARDGLELRQVDGLAASRPPPLPRAQRDGERPRVPAREVGVRVAEARRAAAGLAHQQRVPRERLQRRAVAHVIAVGTGEAEARHADADDVGRSRERRRGRGPGSS